MGTVDTNAQMAPVRRLGLDATGHEAGPAAGNLGTLNRDARAEAAPRGLRENEGRAAGAAPSGKGRVRSYAEVYNATLNESRGMEASDHVKPAMASVSAASRAWPRPACRWATGRTCSRAHAGRQVRRARALGDFGGDVTREARAIDSAALAQGYDGAMKATVPSGRGTMGVSGNSVVGLEKPPTFIENREQDLDIASSQLAQNPLSAPIV